MTNNPTIDGVSRELLELLLGDRPDNPSAAWKELRARLDADHTGDSSAMVSPAKCDGNHGGPRCADPECWNDAPEVERQEPVAYLDIGVGGYLDIGSDLTDEQLSNLPKGRHALAIVGTYGVDGYTDLQSTIAQLQARIAELETNQFEGWGIDTTTGRPILVFEGCSVIEDVRAYQIIRMLKASAELDSGKGEPVAFPGYPPVPGDRRIAPLAPVAAYDISQHLEAVIAMFTPLDRACNRTLVEARACLDATAALNKTKGADWHDVAGDDEGLAK